MSTPLHDDIAQALDLEPEDARAQLDAFLAELRQRVERDGSAAIDGLGTFTQRGDDIEFVPDDGLAEAVNHEYAHLSAIPLAEEPAGSAPPPDASAPDADESGPDAAEPDSEVKPEPAEAEREPETVTPASRTPEPSEPASRVAPTRSDDAPSRWIPIALLSLLLVLGGLGWYALGERGLISGPQTILTSADDPSPAAPDPNASDPDEAEAALDAEVPDAADEPAEPDAADSEEPNDEATDPTEDRFAIVVTSRTSQAAAEAELDAYADQFADTELPVALISETDNDQTRYRVAIGDYASAEVADDARADMSDMLPDGAWILRLDPDTL